MASRIPSKEKLAQVTSAATALLDAIHRYSTRMGGQRYQTVSRTPWHMTLVGLVEAMRNLEKTLNPHGLPIGHKDRGFRVISGWPIATIGEALN
jgi:hypothetical protein